MRHCSVKIVKSMKSVKSVEIVKSVKVESVKVEKSVKSVNMSILNLNPTTESPTVPPLQLTNDKLPLPPHHRTDV